MVTEIYGDIERTSRPALDPLKPRTRHLLPHYAAAGLAICRVGGSSVITDFDLMMNLRFEFSIGRKMCQSTGSVSR